MKKTLTFVIAALLIFTMATASLAGGALATSADDLAMQILGMQQEREEEAAVEALETVADTPGEAVQETPAEPETNFAPVVSGLEPGVFMYTVTANHPANQIGGANGGFNLLMEKDGKQTVDVTVSNTGSETAVVKAMVEPAITNTNGIMQMIRSPYAPDPSQKYDFTELVKAQETSIELKPGESKTMSFDITMPGEDFEGTLMGGLVFEREPSEEELNATGGMGIVNVYSYILGMRLSLSEELVAPVFELTDVFANVMTAYGPSIKVFMRNPVALYASGITMDIKIAPKDSPDAPVAEHKQTAMEFAPNTAMYFSWRNDEKLPDGEYLATIALEYAGETYTFEKEITVEGTQAEADVLPPRIDVEPETVEE